MLFQPMPLQRRSLPFDDPDWIYELKMDGFRALAIVEHGRAQLLSLPSLHRQNQSPTGVQPNECGSMEPMAQQLYSDPQVLHDRA